MDAQHKDLAHIHELAGSLTASAKKGVTAAFRVSTSDPAVALEALKALRVGVFAIAVGVSVSAAVILTWEHPRQKSAALALSQDDDDGHSPGRLEPPA
jgi:hypothetical protein